jgi:hypothetical protein
MPRFVEVSLVDGFAERVLGVSAESTNIEGSILLEATAPAEADTTELLLLTVSTDYLFLGCQPRRAERRTLIIDDVFPLTLDPGQQRTVQLDFVLADPTNSYERCGPPESLQVGTFYYDTSVYEWLDLSSIEAKGQIDLNIDPDAVGPSDWSCLGSADPPEYEAGRSLAMVWVRAFETGTILPGASVKVCALSDGDCSVPIDEGFTDFTGLWPLAVPTDGPYYFEVSGVTGYVTSLFFEYQVPGQARFDITLTPFSEVELTNTLAELGVAPQAGRGHLAMTAKDCRGDAAIGVSFDVGGSGITESYWDDGDPSTAATETSVDAFALFANVPADPTVVNANLVADNSAQIGTRNTWVRAGAVTFLATDPSPISF